MDDLNMTIPFRKQPKVAVGIEIPKRLRSHLEREARRRGWSLAMTTADALCRGSGINPADFGIPEGIAPVK